MPETRYFEKDITLSTNSLPAGASFPARLAYWTFGSPSNPAVLLPSCYGGTLEDTLPFLYSDSVSPNPPLPPSKFFIIVTALLGGGESSSPSNTPAPWSGINFPHVTYEDNIRLQYALCESLGIKQLFAYIGFSMGGQQAYHMSVLYPDFIQHMACLAGSARTSWHNWCFLEGPRAALSNSIDFQDGEYTTKVKRGKYAFSRAYSAWALSPEWFRERQWESLGFDSLEKYLDKYWGEEGDEDANDLLALLWTWQQGNVCVYFAEDGNVLGKTLVRIRAKCLIMPSRTDQYFPPADSEDEVKALKNGTLRIIDTVWGHIAGGGSGTAADVEFIKTEIARFLNI